MAIDTSYYSNITNFDSLRLGQIPKHKLARILGKNDKPLIVYPNKVDSNHGAKEVPLWYDDELSLKFNSNYKSLCNLEPPQALTILSGITDGIVPSGHFAINGSQIWNSTSPLDISFTVKIEMDNDGGYNDVVLPTMSIVNYCLPEKSKMQDGDACYAIGKKLGCLIPPGPTVLDILKMTTDETSDDMAKETTASKIEETKSYNRGRGCVTIQLGKFTFRNVLLKNVNPTFSSTVDDYGYPISAELSIDATTMLIPTTDYLSTII